MILAGAANMPPTIRPASARLYRERAGVVDRDWNGDRLPSHIAWLIIITLSLSLWGGIGFLVSALL
jgi:hypothetical protein